MPNRDEQRVDIDEILAQDELVLAAVRKGSLAAMRKHVQAGQPMVAWKNGKTVEIPPEELVEILKAADDS